MADLAVITRVRLLERVGEGITIPAAAATGPGVPVYEDTNGKAAIAAAGVAGTAVVVGINLSHKLNAANLPADLLERGKLVLYDTNGANILAGLAYGAPVYLSNTAGRLADAAGTVSVLLGRVRAFWDQGTPTKYLDADCSRTG